MVCLSPSFPTVLLINDIFILHLINLILSLLYSPSPRGVNPREDFSEIWVDIPLQLVVQGLKDPIKMKLYYR